MLQPVAEQGERLDEGVVAERGPVIGGPALANQGLGHQQVGIEGTASLFDHRPGVAPLSCALGVPVVRPKIAETTALGVAYLAGLAVGYWKDPGEIASQWQIDRIFEPDLSPERREELKAGWAKAVNRAKEWETPDIA